MGRKRKHNKDLPARIYERAGAFYFVRKDGKWVPLGKSKPEALRAYADLLQRGPETFSALADKYRALIMPRKAPKTQREQLRQLAELETVFGSMPVRSITRGIIARYRDEKGAESPVSANRMLALLGHMFERAREWEMISENPVRSVEKFRETPRDRYVTDDEFNAVYLAAGPMLRVMMGLALLTGQREADLLRLRTGDVNEQGIAFRQGKTGKRLTVRWSEPLASIMRLAAELPRPGVASTFVVCQPTGQPYTGDGFRNAWQKHMRDCIAKGVIEQRYTFHDLRAKAGSDAPDGTLLGHADPRMLKRVYARKGSMHEPTH